ncbi:hypothetical protein SDC9_186237 [bioreactor metagenome]|uniref:Uncharacterized protein n=1 Tax=bioreactor metagenome TaxID=1076179 RepID=A0A645HK02_9ZZZZ
MTHIQQHEARLSPLKTVIAGKKHRLRPAMKAPGRTGRRAIPTNNSLPMNAMRSAHEIKRPGGIAATLPRLGFPQNLCRRYVAIIKKSSGQRQNLRGGAEDGDQGPALFSDRGQGREHHKGGGDAAHHAADLIPAVGAVGGGGRRQALPPGRARDSADERRDTAAPPRGGDRRTRR